MLRGIVSTDNVSLDCLLGRSISTGGVADQVARLDATTMSTVSDLSTLTTSGIEESCALVEGRQWREITSSSFESNLKTSTTTEHSSFGFCAESRST